MTAWLGAAQALNAKDPRDPRNAVTPGTKTEFAGSNQSLTGELVRQGATGAAGHVAEPYLIAAIRPDVPVVSVLDGHSHTLAFIGSALGVTQLPLGVDSFGQSGARADLYRHYGIDAPSIARAATLLLGSSA